MLNTRLDGLASVAGDEDADVTTSTTDADRKSGWRHRIRLRRRQCPHPGHRTKRLVRHQTPPAATSPSNWRGSATSSTTETLRCRDRSRRLASKRDFNTVVFCRYIDTANYLGEHLGPVLRKKFPKLDLQVVTSELPDDLRKHASKRCRQINASRADRHRLSERRHQSSGPVSRACSITTCRGTPTGSSSAKAA